MAAHSNTYPVPVLIELDDYSILYCTQLYCTRALLFVNTAEEIVEPYDTADSDNDEWDVPGDFELRNCMLSLAFLNLVTYSI